ncbi:MAG: hypothetical protein ACREO0_13480, partial [Pseudoxanthomonas sp.]
TMIFGLIVALASVGLVVVLWASQPLYFPRGMLDAGSKRSDESQNNWYSSQLGAMDEPVLKAGAGARAYRFTWLRTFHHPIAVRITYENSTANLMAVELDGAGGYSPGSVLRRKDVALSQSQFSDMERLISQSGFWDMPSSERTEGLDGSEWIIEGATSKYHVVTRWTPTSGPARKIGLHFLSLAGWEIPADETY